MANTRTYKCIGLVTNGVSVGGLATLSFDGRQAVLASPGHGAIGAEDVDRLPLSCDVALQCQDPDKGLAILNATPASTLWSIRNSGVVEATGYTDCEVATANAKIVWASADLNFPFGSDGTLDLRGKIQFAAGTKKMEDVIDETPGQVAPTLVFPARLYRPNTLSFTPEGEDAIAPDHCQSVALSLNRQVIESAGDADVCMSSVDPLEWSALQVTVTFESGEFVDPSNIMAQLTAAGRGVLTLNLEGRAGAPQQTLTINNLLWHDGGKTDRSDGYAEHRLTGSAGWRKYDAETPVLYDLNATPLFSFA